MYTDKAIIFYTWSAMFFSSLSSLRMYKAYTEIFSNEEADKVFYISCFKE